eukprot:scaffold3918_cov66-Phaeocystis_antarctica.AAC.2
MRRAVVQATLIAVAGSKQAGCSNSQLSTPSAARTAGARSRPSLQLRCRARSHLPNVLTFRRSPTSSTSAL